MKSFQKFKDMTPVVYFIIGFLMFGGSYFAAIVLNDIMLMTGLEYNQEFMQFIITFAIMVGGVFNVFAGIEKHFS